MLLAALSGLLLTGAFPKIGLDWLAWFALVPLLAAIANLSVRKSFRIGFITGLVHYLSLLYWVVPVMRTYGYLPLYLSVAILFLFAAVLALFPAVFSMALAAIGSHTGAVPNHNALALGGAGIYSNLYLHRISMGIAGALAVSATPFDSNRRPVWRIWSFLFNCPE